MPTLFSKFNEQRGKKPQWLTDTTFNISGHYFIVWLMMKNTYFTVLYTNPASDEYKEATKRIIYEVGLSTVVVVL